MSNLALALWTTPDKEGQMHHVGADNLYLIPTASADHKFVSQ